jgi:DNA ligase 1
MYKIIDEIQVSNSKLHKEAVLEREARAGNAELFQGLRFCYDPMINFGVKQVPEKAQGQQGQDLSHDAFVELCHQLQSRELTGNAAQKAIEDAMHCATEPQWNGWYRRVLIKDMRSGFSETTINKAVKRAGRADFGVPLFECQLAHDAANHDTKLSGKKILDYKLDGVRVLAVIAKGVVTLHSRNGKVFENFPHIEQQIRQASGDLEADWVLDGEITSSSFQDLMRQVHRKRDADASDAVYNLFDIIPLKDFRTGRHDLSQLKRSKRLHDFIGHFTYPVQCTHIQLLDFEIADLDTAEGQELLAHMRKRACDLGLEGVMVKDAAAPYECKRSTAWLKIKPVIEVSLQVVAVEPGTGRNQDRLGALVCEGLDDGREIQVNVGSGFSDSDRDSFWNDRDQLLGMTVEVRADAVTQNQDGSYSLRFPRFLRFRGFDLGEKL